MTAEAGCGPMPSIVKSDKQEKSVQLMVIVNRSGAERAR